ncbi:hypothetical protein KEF85_09735 [Methylomonas paludis]|uniref:Uncharacterized protein n=1 Tax=Methylomonas paludis TaxID=1173101 RepID=A0A975MKW5_9GAMM|nr:hypothetical protein [Methylomonas paludis]QWF69657.1 hypothetical protein KEF85_09735 [Methylomonas paludis]
MKYIHAKDGWLAVKTNYDEILSGLNVDTLKQYPVIGWYVDDPLVKPITPVGIFTGEFSASIAPNGRVYSLKLEFTCLADWLEYLHKLTNVDGGV